jgi:hypothetical protein
MKLHGWPPDLPRSDDHYPIGRNSQRAPGAPRHNSDLKNNLTLAEGMEMATAPKAVSRDKLTNYNFAIFCGTAQAMSTDLMRGRFGNRLVKIHSAKRFAEIARELLGAKKYHLHKVIYRNRKMHRSDKTLRNFKISASDGLMNEPLFGALYESGFLPSLFIKPVRFQVEQEIRIAFELNEDIPNFISKRNADLAKCIEVVS